MEKVTTKHLEKALQIAINAHYGQEDKAGEPYIFHPLRVMNRCHSLEAKVVAILHDVAEDTNVSIKDISKESFPSFIIEAVSLLYHNKDTDYFDYIRKLADNPLAKEVKLADLKDNSDASRMKKIKKKEIERLKKYNKALKLLTQNDMEKQTSAPDLSKHKYITLWGNIVKNNLEKFKNPGTGTSIQLSESDFEAVGNRKSYRFNLELSDGMCVNNIGGSAVARDLYAVLDLSGALKKIFGQGYYKINMDKNFILHINKLK